MTADYGRQAAADLADYQAGITNLGDILAEEGKDLATHIKERAEENEMLREAGMLPETNGNGASLPHTMPGQVEDDKDQDPASLPNDEIATSNAQQTLTEQGLNGAQVAAILEILTNYSTGLITADAAKALILTAFPTLSEESINTVIRGTNVNKSQPAQLAVKL
jgi:hypothetical protein